MTKQEMAFQIFLKRLPNEHLIDANRAWFVSKSQEAIELAELFYNVQITIQLMDFKLPEGAL